MKRYLTATLLGLAALSMSPLANARVDLNIGLGVPGYYGPPPVVYQPQPVYAAPPVVYGNPGWGHRDWRHDDHRDWHHDDHDWHHR
jgi:hypothetical protein